MSRVHNFSAGPATLPLSVLEQVQSELLDWRGTGMSVMEMSHRDKPFMSIAAEAEADLRELLGVPASYKVLFMQGGATAQFGVIPMNLLRGRDHADFLVTGVWSRKAVMEFRQYGTPHIVAEPADGRYDHVPAADTWLLSDDAAYFHYTPNETIEGVELHDVPEVGTVPLVADFSSSFLSRPIEVERYGLIFAGAQKNLGPAGLTIVIVREDLIGQTHPALPSVFDYKAVADSDSMLNTPPCFAWYVSGLVLKWIKAQGGLEAMAARNARKSSLLYDYIDAQSFYRCPVARPDRSWMNVTFALADDALDTAFLDGAKAAGLPGLKGHRLVGGMRASLYNAMDEAGVQALVDYMREFARTRG